MTAHLRCPCAALLLELAAAVQAVQAQAQPPLLGPEFQVNTYTPGVQYSTGVAMSPVGDFVVVWESNAPAGTFHEIFAQRFAANGSRRGGEFQVNTFTANNQSNPAVAMRTDGGFVVVWDTRPDYTSLDVVGQRFSSAGLRLGTEFIVNSFTSSRQGAPAIAVDAQGAFFVTWEDNGRGGSFPAISGRIFNAAGIALGPDFQVSSYTPGQSSPDVAASSTGEFIVVWSSAPQDGYRDGIFAQLFASSGERIGLEVQVNAYTEGNQISPAVAATAGGWFVTWDSKAQDGDGYGVFARKLVDGVPQGGEIQVPTHTLSIQSLGDVAADPSGDYIVVWGTFDEGAYHVMGRRFNQEGVADGIEFRINSYTLLPEQAPVVAVDARGAAVVAWSGGAHFPLQGQDGSSNGIFAQRLGDLIRFDVDRDGSFEALTDGLLFLRFAFGFRDLALITGAVDEEDCTRCMATEIEAFLESLGLALDVDGDGAVGPLTDAVLTLRWAFGLRGDALTAGAVGPDCTRCSATEIDDYLATWAD